MKPVLLTAALGGHTVRTTCLSLLAALAATTLAAPAVAGPADAPLPLIGGEETRHVFTVPGVIQSSGLATTFVCTLLEKTDGASWGVEIFRGGGGGLVQNDVSMDNGTRVVGAGDTNAVSTAAIAAVDPGDIITGLGSSRANTSARIVSTSSKIACSAVVLDPLGDPPSVAWELPVIKRTRQKGD